MTEGPAKTAEDASAPPEHDVNRLAAFADRRLGAADHRAMLEHLAGCAECRTVMASLAKGGAIGQRPQPWHLRAGWLSLAAAAIIAVAAGTYLLAPGVEIPPAGSPSPPPPDTATATPAPPGATPSTEPPDVVRGPETRSVEGRAFHLVAGEWVDAAYDPADVLPVVTIRTSAERARAVAAHPKLAPFLALGPRVTVVFERTVYRADVR